MNDCDRIDDEDAAMRINERALASYSVSSATPVDRAGWLWKRGEVNREDALANLYLSNSLKMIYNSEIRNLS